MAILATIVVITVIIGASAGAVKAAKGLLDELGFDRSSIVRIVNATNEILRVEVVEAESGAIYQQPSYYIEPRSDTFFLAHSRHALEGNSGHCTIEGSNFTMFVDWSNPLVGGNDIDVSVVGPRAGEFTHREIAGGGATGAELRVDLSYADPGRMQQLLTAQPYGGFLPLPYDPYCGPYRGELISLADGYDARKAGAAVVMDLLATDGEGKVRTGRCFSPTPDPGTGGFALDVFECVDGHRGGQWSGVQLVEVFGRGSYAVTFAIPGFAETAAALTEREDYVHRYAGGSTFMIVCYRAPVI